jgi:hypothetical protein
MSILTNYLLTARRNSMKYKGPTLLNILGLANVLFQPHLNFISLKPVFRSLP